MSESRVDRDNGIIKGVSLIAIGDARGHKKAVDQRTLETVRDCAKQYGKLRVKFNPTTFNHGNGSLAGYIPAESLRIENNKTLGDIHLYKAFPAEAKEYLYEIAETTPNNIGLSIEFTGDDETINKQKFARCEEIFAATIVDLPAANPTGLFAASDLTKGNKDQESSSNDDNPENQVMNEEQLKQLMASITGSIEAGFTALTQKFAEKKEDMPTKEEMAAAGCADGDDEATKKQKIEAYRASKSSVTTMSRGELEKTVADTAAKTFMQCFRQTGGKPAKISPDGGEGDGKKDFEALINEDMAAGGVSKGKSVMRMRKLHPEEYNEFMAGKHPSVQHLVTK
jgi:hypothetical protein